MLVRSLPGWVGVLGLVALAATAQPVAAQLATDYQPDVGQMGKDVVWVPTASGLVGRMLDLAQVTPADYVIDLGSGDGRTVIAAAERGARALGVEYEQGMVDLATESAAKAGVGGRATFVKADLFETDFSHATVLTMFLLPDLNLRLRPKILAMRPGTRVVSNTFTMDDWEPDRTAEEPAPGCRSYCKALLWIVPAKVAGRWRLGEGELVLEQTFQMLSGSVTFGNVAHPITEGRMRGEEITFTAGGRTFTGRVNGEAMEGTSGSDASTTAWRATRP